eukprot:680745-Pyramimonas_sp.AAC.1
MSSLLAPDGGSAFPKARGCGGLARALGIMIIWEFERLSKTTFAAFSVEVVLNTLAYRKVPLACRTWPVYRDRALMLTLCRVSVVART